MTDKKVGLSRRLIGRRRALADSDNSSSECDKELLLPATSTTFCKNCCSCDRGQIHKNKSKSRDKQLLPGDSKLNRTSYREQLEMKVLNEEVSQQVSSETWRYMNRQVDQLDAATMAFNTLLHSLHLTASTVHRLHSLMSNQDNTFEEKYDEICEKVSEVIEVMREVEAKKEGSDETDAFLARRSDLTKASTNFANILRRPSLPSHQQLSRLEQQYDDIRSQYSQAKLQAYNKVNTSIQLKTEHIYKCFQRLLSVLTTSVDLEKHMIILLNDTSIDSIKKRIESMKSSNSVAKPSPHGDPRRKSCTCFDSCS